MEIIYKHGDLLKAETDVIAHQVNCSGAFGSGVAKQVRDKWPRVYEQYMKAYASGSPLLGSVQVVKADESGKDKRLIANIFGQENYGHDGNKYTSYDALDTALRKLCSWMESHGANTVAFPYKMGSDRGGGEWDIVVAIIKTIFRNSNITIEFWAYGG